MEMWETHSESWTGWNLLTVCDLLQEDLKRLVVSRQDASNPPAQIHHLNRKWPHWSVSTLNISYYWIVLKVKEENWPQTAAPDCDRKQGLLGKLSPAGLSSRCSCLRREQRHETKMSWKPKQTESQRCEGMKNLLMRIFNCFRFDSALFLMNIWNVIKFINNCCVTTRFYCFRF